MLGTVMPTGLDGLAADVQTKLSGLVGWPTAHPRLNIRRWVMKNGFLENYGFWLRILLRNFCATLQIEPVRLTDHGISCHASAQFLRDLPCRQAFSPKPRECLHSLGTPLHRFPLF